jgi:N-acetylneuraminic acid mutarotase
VAVAAVAFRVYVIGGVEADGTISDKVEVFDTYTEKWSEAAALPEPLHHAAATEWHGQLSVFGGMNSQGMPTSAIYQYSTLENEWESAGGMSAPRAAQGVAMWHGSPAVVSGVGIAGDDSLVELSSAETYFVDYWLQIQDIPTPRSYLAAAVSNDTLYVIGGRPAFDSSRSFDVIEEYTSDPSPPHWESREPMPTGRSGLAAVALDRGIYVIGGESGEEVMDRNEMYDPNTDSWKSWAPMPTARHGLGAAVVGDAIYVFGGSLEDGSVTGANEAFTP